MQTHPLEFHNHEILIKKGNLIICWLQQVNYFAETDSISHSYRDIVCILLYNLNDLNVSHNKKFPLNWILLKICMKRKESCLKNKKKEKAYVFVYTYVFPRPASSILLFAKNGNLLTLYFWAFSDSHNWFLASRHKTNGTSPTFLLFLGSLRAMTAGRCDLYSLLLVTLFQAVPKVSEREGSSMQQTVETLMPQKELSNAVNNTDTSTENVLRLGKWKKINCKTIPWKYLIYKSTLSSSLILCAHILNPGKGNFPMNGSDHKKNKKDASHIFSPLRPTRNYKDASL